MSSVRNKPSPLLFLLLLPAGRVTRCQAEVIECLKEESRILRGQLIRRRLRSTDEHRRRLAAKGSALGRERLSDVASIATPDTLVRRYRRLVANNYDGSMKRAAGRPGTEPEVADLVVLSIESEGPDRVVPPCERHPSRAVRELVRHYQEDRPHQDLGGKLIVSDAAAGLDEARGRRERLGGPLGYSHRVAA